MTTVSVSSLPIMRPEESSDAPIGAALINQQKAPPSGVFRTNCSDQIIMVNGKLSSSDNDTLKGQTLIE